jgi:hypothetical protein
VGITIHLIPQPLLLNGEGEQFQVKFQGNFFKAKIPGMGEECPFGKILC